MTETVKPVIVTVEPRLKITELWQIHCTRCGFIRGPGGKREAEQWAQHHRLSVHPNIYRPLTDAQLEKLAEEKYPDLLRHD
jgi:hypothetical protein